MIFKKVNICLGVWLVIANLSIFSSLWIKVNNAIVGAFAVIIGAAMMNKKLGLGWISILLGYWLVLSVCIPCITVNEICIWNSLIVGSILIMEGLLVKTNNLFNSKDFHLYQ